MSTHPAGNAPNRSDTPGQNKKFARRGHLDGLVNTGAAALLPPLGYLAGMALLLTLALVALRVPVVPAYGALWSGAIGSPDTGYWYPLSETLVKSTPLILAGLSVTVAWRAGMFSLGAEGQLLIGALASLSVWAVWRSGPPAVVIPTMLLSGGLAGAAWSAAAGWMRTRRGAPEVITTIMLNYVALNLIGWLVSDQGALHGRTQSGPHSDPLPTAIALPRVVPLAWAGVQTRLHFGAALALIAVPVVWAILYRTAPGFGMRITGQNPEAARTARFPTNMLRMQAMALAGALAGLAGSIELLGVTGRLGRDFSGGWGYTAIPVALLGGLSPLGTLFSGLFFGALAAGCNNAQRTVGLPSVVAYVIQAATVLGIVGARAWKNRAAGTEAD